MLGGLFKGWARRRLCREAEGFLAHLKDLDDQGAALVLVIAMHQRNKLMAEGINLRDLTGLARQQPQYQAELVQAAGVLNRNKRYHDALGLQVWIHSLRAIADPALLPLVRAIWVELSRGRPLIGKTLELLDKETGIEIDVAMAGSFPPEFTDV